MVQSNQQQPFAKTLLWNKSTEDAVPGAAGHHFAGLQLFPDAHFVPQPVGSLEPRLAPMGKSPREILEATS